MSSFCFTIELMYRRLLVFGCKVLIKVLRILGKNGSALPGLIIERVYPEFLQKNLAPVQSKIILVTGTNGKTTTTKMLVAALRGVGSRVVTNSTGSNMTRGLIAALIEDMTSLGSLKPTDWFVFEMDEAYAPKFTTTISPKAVIALNVLRDQLDRYGEIDKTAKLIEGAAGSAEIFVYNELDPLLKGAAERLKKKRVLVSSFGISGVLASHVENEQTLQGEKIVAHKRDSDVTLVAAEEVGDLQKLTVEIGDGKEEFVIPVKGFHNALNATAVTALLYSLNIPEISNGLNGITRMPTPFGRGEKLHLRGKNVTVALVKNPSGFTSNLETFIKQGVPEAVLFVVNDRIADGRDVSWLWDVDFTPFIPQGSQLYTSGIRGFDMALRLKHDGFDVNTTTNVARSIQSLMKSGYKEITIIPTYTALFEVRTELGRYGKVPRIW